MKIILAICLILIYLSINFAVCPVCTVGVAAGLGILKEYGIDDLIAGYWLGALTLSSAYWLIDWSTKKGIRFFFRKKIITISMYAIFVLPLYFMGFFFQPFNTIFGFDKLLVGIIVGSIVFHISVKFYEKIKELNNGHALFPYQKVITPLIFLAFISVNTYILMAVYGQYVL
ncbi:MAG: hypothetical protein N3E37_03315 [Candidatus Micrarchaeota archaeon]|nr:hypothetical protein [Candidatus Micrarchaeota archaeon]